MVKTFRGIFTVLIFLLLLGGMQAKAYASDSLIYSNDFDKESDATTYSDELHKNALFNQSTTLDMKRLVYDKVTITMWLKSMKLTVGNSYPVSLVGDPENTKGIYVGIDNTKEPSWMIGTGNKVIKSEHVVILDEWIFAAIVFDAENNQFRVILDDKVHAKKSVSDLSFSKLFVDATSCMIDDLQVHQGILTLEQLEEIKGSEINGNRSKYAIIDKTKYINSELTKSIALQEELENSQGQLQYEITSTSFTLEKRIDSLGEYIANLDKGDVVTIKEVIVSQNKVLVETHSGKTGYIASADFYSNLINENTSSLNKFIFSYINISNDSNSKQMVLIFLAVSMIVLMVIVFLMKKAVKFKMIIIRGLFTPSIYLFFIYIIASFLGDKYEMNWFLYEGWKRFPVGYTELVHWFLFSTIIIFILANIVQCIVIIKNCGIVKSLITFICITIINFISLFIIQMVISLSLSYFDRLGYVVIGFFALGCLIYLKENKFFLTTELNQLETLSKTYNQSNYRQNTSSENIRTNRTNNNNNGYSNSTYSENNGAYSDYTYGNNTNKTNSTYQDYQNKNDKSYQEETAHAKGDKPDIKYFCGVTRLDDLKERYYNLMKIYHPDNQCGDTEASKQVSLEYEYLRKILQ